MITAYLALAMWNAFLVGGFVHSRIEPKPDLISNYRITIDYNGNRESVCQENLVDFNQ